MKTLTLIRNVSASVIWLAALVFYVQGRLDHAAVMCLFAILTRLGPCHD